MTVQASGQVEAPSIGEVQQFWNANQCGKKFVQADFGSKIFFQQLEEHRYRLEPHIKEIVPFASFAQKKVLEIGCGLGTDAVQFARAGADYHGIDLTPSAVELTRQRFAFEGLTGRIQMANGEALPFAPDTFDCVYSHGVIHHTPGIEKAVAEIRRVLKPGGQAIVMVYHRDSLNYHLNINLLRRLGIWGLYLPGGEWLVHKLTGESEQALAQHKADFKKMGRKYLSSSIFLSRNTDGAGNPLSRVYTATQFKQLFSAFSSVRTSIRYLNVHRIPLLRSLLPRRWENALAKRWGWHLYLLAHK